jgi:hypothetical protein
VLVKRRPVNHFRWPLSASCDIRRRSLKTFVAFVKLVLSRPQNAAADPSLGGDRMVLKSEQAVTPMLRIAKNG